MTAGASFATARDGTRVAYSVLGSGPPLIFVRGWVSHLDILWADPKFRRYFEALSRHFRVVRFDSRGNGLSDRHLEELSLDDLVSDVEAVFDQLGVDRAVVYGATFGAPIAIRFAGRYPQRVDRLILEGAFARGSRITSRIRRMMLSRALRSFPEMAFVLLAYATHPEEHHTDYRRPEIVRQMIDPGDADSLYSLAFGLDIRAELDAVEAPTLVLHRRESQSVPLRLGREVAEGIPGARLAVLEGRVHNLWEGDARESLRAIGAFLDVDLLDDRRGRVQEEAEAVASGRAPEAPKDVFVSYAREDRSKIAPLVDLLESQGWSVWWDRSISAGSDYPEAIEAALRSARCVVVVWSENSVTSHWVREESSMSRSRGSLVPVRIDAVDPPLGFRSLQAVDLIGWDGRPNEATDGLLEDLSRLLERREAGPVVPD